MAESSMRDLVDELRERLHRRLTEAAGEGESDEAEPTGGDVAGPAGESRSGDDVEAPAGE